MTIRANPDEDMVLYGKSAGGRYHIVRTDDAGVVEVAAGPVDDAVIQLVPEQIQADATWLENVSSLNLSVKTGNPVRSTFNGKNVVQFDGVSALSTAGTPAAISLPGTIMGVCKYDDMSPAKYCVDGNSGSSSSGRWLFGSISAGLNVQAWSGEIGPTVTPAAGTSTNPAVFAATYTAAKIELWFGPEFQTSIVPAQYDFVPMVVGNNWGKSTDNAFGMTGWVGEIYVWDSELSADRVSDVMTWLKTKWGI